jgi:hypothetical protein
VSESPFYTSVCRVARLRGVHRRAELPAGGSAEFGVHGAIREHYRIDAPELPLPVDYIVAATGG